MLLHGAYLLLVVLFVTIQFFLCTFKSFSKPESKLLSWSISLLFASTTSSKSSGVSCGSSSWFFCLISSSIILSSTCSFSRGFVSLYLCKSVPLCSPCIFDCFNYNHLYDSTKRTNKLASCCCLCVLFKLKLSIIPVGDL